VSKHRSGGERVKRDMEGIAAVSDDNQKWQGWRQRGKEGKGGSELGSLGAMIRPRGPENR